jgi:5'-3' exonuclease
MDPRMTKSKLEDWGILKPFRERLADYRSSQAMLNIDVSVLNTNRGSLRTGETAAPSPVKTTQALEVEMRKQDLDILNEPISNLDDGKQRSLIVDYVAICMLLGNDFLPHVPSLKIKDGALTRLINCYKITQSRLPKSHLIKLPPQRTKNIKSQINDAFFVQLLGSLSDYEDTDLKLQCEASQVRRRKFKFRLSQITDPYQKDLTRLEYIEDQWKDTLQLGSPGWKARYYHQYVHSTSLKATEIMVKNYLEGFLWNTRYYLGNRALDSTDMVGTCPDWLWKYNYLVAPSISDIYRFMQGHREFFTKELQITPRPPVRPDVQLMMILPPQSSPLLKPELQTLMTSADSPISFQYPIDFKIDLFGHRYRWECYPILPPTSLRLTRTAVEVALDPRWSDFPIKIEQYQNILKNKEPTVKLKFKQTKKKTDQVDTKKKISLAIKKKIETTK